MPTKKQPRIKVIHLEVGQPASIKEIPNSLAGMKPLLNGGWLEAFYVDAGLCWMVDEEGLLKNLPYNITIAGTHLHGPIFLTRYDKEGESISLTEADIEKAISGLRKIGRAP